MAFRHFGDSYEFNPLAVVFRPFRRTRVFRFWQPFHHFKHGRPEALQQLEGEFWDCLGVRFCYVSRHDERSHHVV
jgi:hypothetical protein